MNQLKKPEMRKMRDKNKKFPIVFSSEYQKYLLFIVNQ